jgi:hypothetical protein
MVNFFTTVLIRETMSLQSQHLRICWSSSDISWPPYTQ